MTLGAGPQWSPGPRRGPWTVNCCCTGGEGGTEAGRGVVQGETETELVEATVSDGEGLVCGVHTSVTGAAAGAVVVGATGVAAVFGTVGEAAPSLLIWWGE